MNDDDPLNPQAKQMADESMVRNLDAQAKAIWPQEVELIRGYGLLDGIRILDAGCGTGEAAYRLAEEFPRSRLLGIDIVDSHLDLARQRCARFGDRTLFENRSIFELDLPDDSFDLTVCRHVMQAIPHAERVAAELARVTRPGGRLHLIAEDYGMIHFQRAAIDPRRFFYAAPAQYGDKMGIDLFLGRDIYGILADLGLAEIRIDYVVVDTLRVPRETFAAILEAWRDGYAEPIGEHTDLTREEAEAYFEQMIANVRDPRGYAVWMVPVASARVG
ncbi:MAG: methyltransferase domain-containing protein [Candidatus Eisenbacteria bacterium]|nr:methyltransferase domain-containing protein [Candidatus Eisenbacteria bacterium]